MKLISIVGARPQFIKAAVIHRALKEYSEIDEIIVHSGQHYDENMSDIFFKELEISPPKYNLGVGSGKHGEQTAKMLSGFEELFLLEKPDVCLVYGDTNSTLAAALAAVKLHIPVAHVEAGLRSFNRHMPEEINRIATDHISEWLFAPTSTAMTLLENEGLKDKSYFVGDVMYDSAIFYSQNNNPYMCAEGSYFLATVHRAENTDSYERLTSICDAFNNINTPIILPLHPRTRKYITEYGIKLKEHVKVIDPVGYKEMIRLIEGSTKVLTDSGGLQKEAYFLKKQCITLRDETEWVETLDHGWNTLVGASKSAILDAVSNHSLGSYINHYGDGNSGKHIIRRLLKSYNE